VTVIQILPGISVEGLSKTRELLRFELSTSGMQVCSITARPTCSVLFLRHGNLFKLKLSFQHF
jgi:hypothetical protein